MQGTKQAKMFGNAVTEHRTEIVKTSGFIVYVCVHLQGMSHQTHQKIQSYLMWPIKKHYDSFDEGIKLFNVFTSQMNMKMNYAHLGTFNTMNISKTKKKNYSIAFHCRITVKPTHFHSNVRVNFIMIFRSISNHFEWNDFE